MRRIYRKGGKQSPASPASPSAQDLVPSKKVPRLQSAAHGALDWPRCTTHRRRNLQTLSPDHTRADPVILGRLRHLLAAINPILVDAFSADWLAQAMSRVDGGPLLDPPRLGPCLRQLGFVPLRRRRGNRRVTVWLAPGATRPRRGRPPSRLDGG
jgi:hypothetical protein